MNEQMKACEQAEIVAAVKAGDKCIKRRLGIKMATCWWIYAGELYGCLIDNRPWDESPSKETPIDG
jgi:hypothetical protein